MVAVCVLKPIFQKCNGLAARLEPDVQYCKSSSVRIKSTYILALFRHPDCRKGTMQPSFDLEVPIQRLRVSCEKHSKADTIPEAPSKAPRSRIAAGEKAKSTHKSDTSLMVVRR